MSISWFWIDLTLSCALVLFVGTVWFLQRWSNRQRPPMQAAQQRQMAPRRRIVRVLKGASGFIDGVFHRTYRFLRNLSWWGWTLVLWLIVLVLFLAAFLCEPGVPLGVQGVQEVVKPGWVENPTVLSYKSHAQRYEVRRETAPTEPPKSPAVPTTSEKTGSWFWWIAAFVSVPIACILSVLIFCLHFWPEVKGAWRLAWRHWKQRPQRFGEFYAKRPRTRPQVTPTAAPGAGTGATATATATPQSSVWDKVKDNWEAFGIVDLAIEFLLKFIPAFAKELASAIGRR